MWQGATTAYLEALRRPHRAYGFIEAWRGGQLLPFNGGNRLPVIPDSGSSVDIDSSTPGVRRKLAATFARLPGLWDQLSPIGTELRAYNVLEFGDGKTITVPQGVFDIDVQTMSYVGGEGIKVTAPDRYVRVQRARFLVPRASQGGDTAARQAAQLMLEALPPGTSVTYSNSGESQTPQVVWDRDRAKAVEDLLTAGALDGFLDRAGNVVIRDAPNTGTPVWTVNAGSDGVLINADRSRDRQRTYNVVVVNSTAVDDAPLFAAPVIVWDRDPGSPTYAGPDPLGRPDLAGPFGVRPTFYASPLLSNVDQARSAGQSILARVTGLAKTLNLTSVVNPALEDGDTIRVVLPGGEIEDHVIEQMSIPLFPSRDSQTITTRSTRPDDGGDDEETS